MSSQSMYGLPQPFASEAIPAQRAEFIRKTYAHLGGAILAFVLLELAIFQTAIPDMVLRAISGGRYTWLLVMGGFMLVSWLASRWAQSEQSESMQYAGLGLYVVAEALIFIPILKIAQLMAPGGSLLTSAALVTLMLFTGLTVTVFATQKDFSFMGSILTIGGFIAMGVIICSAIFGFQLGVLFSGVMVLFAAGAILYDTSNVLHHYRVNQHVAASLALFASVALLFWYVLRLFMNLRSDD
jgi:FtsH-binding integral membrane protein